MAVVTPHIRAKLARLPRGNTFYKVHDTRTHRTLCGAPITTVDLGWGDTRGRTARAWMAEHGCGECLRLRVAADQPTTPSS